VILRYTGVRVETCDWIDFEFSAVRPGGGITGIDHASGDHDNTRGGGASAQARSPSAAGWV
jgi:hypothetical protein